MEHEKKELIELNSILAQLIARVGGIENHHELVEVLSLKVELKTVREQLETMKARFVDAEEVLNSLNLEKITLSRKLEQSDSDLKGAQLAAKNWQSRAELAEQQARGFQESSLSLSVKLQTVEAAYERDHATVLSLTAQLEQLQVDKDQAWERVHAETSLRVKAENETITLKEQLDILKSDYESRIAMVQTDTIAAAHVVKSLQESLQEQFEKRLQEALLGAQRGYELEVHALRQALLQDHERRDAFEEQRFRLLRESFDAEKADLQRRLALAETDLHRLQQRYATLQETVRGMRLPATPGSHVDLQAELVTYREYVSQLRKALEEAHSKTPPSHKRKRTSLYGAIVSKNNGSLVLQLGSHDDTVRISNVGGDAVRVDAWTLEVTNQATHHKSAVRLSGTVGPFGELIVACGSGHALSFADLAELPAAGSFVLADSQGHVSAELSVSSAATTELFTPGPRTRQNIDG